MTDAELDSYELLASTIDLANKGVDASNVARLVEEQFAQKHNATTLDLGWNNLREEGTAELVQVLLGRPHKLRALDLWANGIGTEGAISLAQIFLSNTTLTSVNLRKNSISARGIATILEAIRTNQHQRLEQLDVSMNIQGPPEVVEAFSRPLNNPTPAIVSQLLHLLKSTEPEPQSTATVHQVSSRGAENVTVPTSAGSRYSSRSAGTRTWSDGSSERNIVSEDGDLHSGKSLCRSISLPLGVCSSSSRATKAKLIRAIEQLQTTVSEQNTRIKSLEQSAPSTTSPLTRDEQLLEERLMRRTTEMLRKFCSFYMKRETPSSPDTAEQDITFLELAGERIVNTDRTEREKPVPSVEVALYSVLLPEVQRLEARLAVLENTTEEKLELLSQKQSALQERLAQATLSVPHVLEQRIADLEGRFQAVKMQLKATKDSFQREVTGLNAQLAEARFGKSGDKFSESTATPQTASKRKATVWWEDRYADNTNLQQLLGESEETLSQARMQLVGLIGEVEHLRSPRRALPAADEQVSPNPLFKSGPPFPRSKILPQFPQAPAVHPSGAAYSPLHHRQPQPVSPVTSNSKQAPRTVSALTPRSAAQQVTVNTSSTRKTQTVPPQLKSAASSPATAPRRQPSLTPVPANVTELQMSLGNQAAVASSGQTTPVIAAACPSPPATLAHSPSPPPPYSGPPFSSVSIVKPSRRGAVPAANR